MFPFLAMLEVYWISSVSDSTIRPRELKAMNPGQAGAGRGSSAIGLERRKSAAL
jgi:hypothetical protein